MTVMWLLGNILLVQDLRISNFAHATVQPVSRLLVNAIPSSPILGNEL